MPRGTADNDGGNGHVVGDRMVIRHFFWGEDVALPRLWPFHDLMAARDDIEYHVHLVGGYGGASDDVTSRPYVAASRRAVPRARQGEVWIIRGWNRPQLIARAVQAHARRVPIVMWAERPGQTYEARNARQGARIAARRAVLPGLFLPYRSTTVVLGAGQLAISAFRKLAPHAPVHSFPYPDAIADRLVNLQRPARGNRPVRLLFVGKFERIKAVDVLAEACERLWNEGNDLTVRYVGRGAWEGLLDDHVGRSDGRAERHPFASGTELDRHFAECDVVVLPSRRDGWGLPVQEGLAAGMPVVVSDQCGACELIAESGCGAVVRADDVEQLARGIERVLAMVEHPEGDLAARCRSVVADMTMPRLADVLVARCHEARALVGAR